MTTVYRYDPRSRPLPAGKIRMYDTEGDVGNYIVGEQSGKVFDYDGDTYMICDAGDFPQYRIGGDCPALCLNSGRVFWFSRYSVVNAYNYVVEECDD